MMFGKFEARPDRCEVCKFSVRETRYACSNSMVPPAYGGCRPHDTIEVWVCKRMPPTPNERGDGVSPVVREGDYCGEFMAKEAA